MSVIPAQKGEDCQVRLGMSAQSGEVEGYMWGGGNVMCVIPAQKGENCQVRLKTVEISAHLFLKPHMQELRPTAAAASAKLASWTFPGCTSGQWKETAMQRSALYAPTRTTCICHLFNINLESWMQASIILRDSVLPLCLNFLEKTLNCNNLNNHLTTWPVWILEKF